MGALDGRSALVVGGGVAGLTAALALARRGAIVRLVERAPALREVGAGIQVSPNAGRALDALGLGPALAAAGLRLAGVALADHHGRAVARLDYARVRPRSAFRVVHRGALVALLARACAAAGVRIETGVAGGADADAPLVIAADGVFGALRDAVDGPGTPAFAGQVAWRAIIPAAADPGPVTARLVMGPGRHVVAYPLAGGGLNLVAVEERATWSGTGWTQPDDPAVLRAAFAGFGGPVPGWLAQVAEVAIWGLHRRPVARTWTDGRIALVGDAAHPTLPFLAQGACMAIEDGAALAACLDADPDQPRALARFQAARRPRCAAIVAAADANARNYHLSGPAATLAHAGLRLASRAAPGALVRRFGWIFDHDPTGVPADVN